MGEQEDQEDQKLKASLNYNVSLRLAWAELYSPPNPHPPVGQQPFPHPSLREIFDEAPLLLQCPREAKLPPF